MKDANLCPLCGDDNHCAIVKDSNANGCWCQQQTINPELIKQANQQSEHKRCICQPCAQKAQRLSHSAG